MMMYMRAIIAVFLLAAMLITTASAAAQCPPNACEGKVCTGVFDCPDDKYPLKADNCACCYNCHPRPDEGEACQIIPMTTWTASNCKLPSYCVEGVCKLGVVPAYLGKKKGN
ncbi:uncharacterized protein [Periplaneta americana]|uniref:uncharacterized protein n=1 Tax=Periplaneta americana TaxID=6978 RepID=UPI0037E85391